MCGFTGFVTKSNIDYQSVIKTMNESLSHRGPDSDGYYLSQVFDRQVALAHKRLSIIDLSDSGRQPMRLNNLSIVFNGEIYNYLELAEELKSLGVKIASYTDTEVLLNAYAVWGIACLQKLNGMFSFAILDEDCGKLMLVRDRAGVKPLYWSIQNNSLIFGSELKALTRFPNFSGSINNSAIATYLELGYILEPLTIYRDVQKVSQGEYIEFQLSNLNYKRSTYWDLKTFYEQPKIKATEAEFIGEIDDLLRSSCELRLRADVPVGVFLSGGYDSATIAAITQSIANDKINTFTIGFQNQKYDESKYARKISQHIGTDHHELICTPSDAERIIWSLVEIWDEPLGDVSCIPTTLVSELASQHVTVSLSADGGDELFGGYNKYTQALKLSQIRETYPRTLQILSRIVESKYTTFMLRVMSSSLRRKLKKISKSAQSESIIDDLIVLSSAFTDKELSELLLGFDADRGKIFRSKENFSQIKHPIDQLLCCDYQTYQCDNILTKVDRATMSVSIEGREPLLDFRLAEFVSRIPGEIKIKNGNKKYLLKKVSNLYLPNSLLDRPKQGFGLPIADWLQHDLKPLLDTTFGGEMKLYNYLRESFVKRIKSEFDKGCLENFNQLWRLFILELWLKRWA